MMTGTSGRASRARGSNSRPLMPGMLMSERMRMRLASSTVATTFSASGADCANSIAKRAERDFTPELLAEQIGDVGLVVDDQDERAHASLWERGVYQLHFHARHSHAAGRS